GRVHILAARPYRSADDAEPGYSGHAREVVHLLERRAALVEQGPGAPAARRQVGQEGRVERPLRRGVGYDSPPYVICIRRTARLAIHRTNAVSISRPDIAQGGEVGAAGAASS